MPVSGMLVEKTTLSMSGATGSDAWADTSPGRPSTRCALSKIPVAVLITVEAGGVVGDVRVWNVIVTVSPSGRTSSAKPTVLSPAELPEVTVPSLTVTVPGTRSRPVPASRSVMAMSKAAEVLVAL